MLIQNTLDNINNYLDVIANDNTISIITLHPSLRYDNDTINAQCISVTMEDNYPYFEIVDLDGMSHAISRDNVINIEITDEPVNATDSINVIDLLNDETTRDVIHTIENTTHYSDIYNPDDLIGDLADIIGSDFCGNGVFSGQGIVYRQTPSGDIRSEIARLVDRKSVV